MWHELTFLYFSKVKYGFSSVISLFPYLNLIRNFRFGCCYELPLYEVSILLVGLCVKPDSEVSFSLFDI